MKREQDDSQNLLQERKIEIVLSNIFFMLHASSVSSDRQNFSGSVASTVIELKVISLNNFELIYCVMVSFFALIPKTTKHKY